jgi:transposase
MAMGRSSAVQGDLMATWADMPRTPGHAFYNRLQELLREAGFDAFVEQMCKPYYAAKMGAPSLPPGRYFRMHAKLLPTMPPPTMPCKTLTSSTYH